MVGTQPTHTPPTKQQPHVLAIQPSLCCCHSAEDPGSLGAHLEAQEAVAGGSAQSRAGQVLSRHVLHAHPPAALDPAALPLRARCIHAHVQERRVGVRHNQQSLAATAPQHIHLDTVGVPPALVPPPRQQRHNTHMCDTLEFHLAKLNFESLDDRTNSDQVHACNKCRQPADLQRHLQCDAVFRAIGGLLTGVLGRLRRPTWLTIGEQQGC